MSDKVFWDIISFACKPSGDESDWYDGLVATLQKLSPEDIVRFDRWFDARVDALYSHDHWGAAYLMNGGASDDGFYYWRCWVVGLGKRVSEGALSNPDSLADVVEPGRDYYEAEIYGVAREAWNQLGLDEDEFDSACDALGGLEEPKLRGTDWDYDDDDEMRRRLPRLAGWFIAEQEELIEEDDGKDED